MTLKGHLVQDITDPDSSSTPSQPLSASSYLGYSEILNMLGVYQDPDPNCPGKDVIYPAAAFGINA
jgi:hypothetical protein